MLKIKVCNVIRSYYFKNLHFIFMYLNLQFLFIFKISTKDIIFNLFYNYFKNIIIFNINLHYYFNHHFKLISKLFIMSLPYILI
jgi:hypothetical protein